jgi:hypothetical protein
MTTTQGNGQTHDQSLRARDRYFLGIYLVLSFVYIVHVLYKIWPSEIPVPTGEEYLYIFPLSNTPIVLAVETRYMLISFLTGMLGSQVFAATAFSYYVAVGKARRGWVWWYILRPFIGGSLALALYFTARGGLLSGGTPENIDLFGIASLSMLAGLFAKKTVDKLEEVFDTIFSPKPYTPKNNGDDKPDEPDPDQER